MNRSTAGRAYPLIALVTVSGILQKIAQHGLVPKAIPRSVLMVRTASKV